MSCFNAEAVVGAAIESILSQSYSNFEFIIIDDGSSDRSVSVITSYALNDNRIVLFEKGHTGLADSLNVGIKLTDTASEFVARMDADDISRSDRLGIQLDYMDRHPHIDLVASGAELLGPEGRIQGTVFYPETHDALAGLLLYSNPFIHSSVFIRKSFFARIGFYNTELLRCQDYELWCRGLIHGSIYATIPQTLVKYRTNSYKRSYRTIAEKFRATIFISVHYGNPLIGVPRSIFDLAKALAIRLNLYRPRSLRLL